MTKATGPRVLAFADRRDSLVAAARVHAPLRALRDAGLVADYVVTDATLDQAPRSGSFDVIWLQRAADPWLADLFARRLAGQYLLDVDDHLLCRPAYLDAGQFPRRSAIVAALRASRTLTSPSARLVRLLERRAGLPLADQAHVCPNALPFAGHPVRPPQRPAAFLITQSHALALTQSRDDVATAIAQGAARHDVPLWCLGVHAHALEAAAHSAGAELHMLRPRQWSEYHRSLAGEPTLLGLAPLETRGDAATLEFVAGKSDIKRVEFTGFGHPAVFSAAPPYAESDLPGGRVVANSGASWAEAIDDLMSTGWQSGGDDARTVRQLRDLPRVATDCWWPAVRAARLERPIDAARLLTDLDRARALARERLARARWLLAHSGILGRRCRRP